MTLLTVEHLRVSYPGERGGRVLAVGGVSFELLDGETLGIVGESGCGKSSVANAITRLVTPSGGRIRFVGNDLTTVSGRALRLARRGIQAVFQDPLDALDPRMRVGASIEEPMKVQGVDSATCRRRVHELAAAVELESQLLTRFPHQLSGGQQQRAVIARALTMRPRLLVLDEPTSSLDFVVRDSIVDLLARIQLDTGCAYVFISHDLGTVRQLAHRVAVMYLGRFVEIGDATEIFSQPAHPYTRALLDAAPVPDPQLRHQRPMILAGDALDEPTSGCAFRPRCPLAFEACGEAPALLQRGSRAVACHRVNGDASASFAPAVEARTPPNTAKRDDPTAERAE
jgi:oligopeptide/dipeptide ABC transporter ATP-binding protein